MELATNARLARFSTAALALGAALLLAACGGGGGGSAAGQGAAASFIPGTNATVSTSVCVTACTSMTASGVIYALASDGFYLDTQSSHGKIKVFTNSSTSVTGPAPFVNESVNVSGTGSWSTSITATSVVQQSSGTPSGSGTATPAPIATPTGVVSTQGSVLGLHTGGFTLDQGLPNGRISVTVPAGALVIGGSIAAGEYVQTTGTGSVHSAITATVVTIYSSAPASVTASGTIVAGTSYGFTLNVDASHPNVPIVLTPAAVIAGGTLMPGSRAQVTGPGSIDKSITPVQVIVTNPTPSPAPNSTPTPTPAPISQKHVLTGDYLGGYYGTKSLGWSSAAPYLTWAQTGVTDANSIAAAGIKTQFYTIPTRVASGDPMYTSNEAEYAHDCSGARISDVFGTSTQYVTDVTTSTLANIYHTTVASQIGSAHFDAVFEDDAGPLTAYGFTTLPCGYSDSAWLAGGRALNDAAPAPVIFNGLSAFNGHDVSLSLGLLSSTNTIGGNLEHCYTDNAIPFQNAWAWIAMENSELQVAAQHKLFECMERNTSSASTSQAARIYSLASFLLTYDPATSILWEEFATTSGFHVEPESQLVALDPVVATPASVSSLLTSSGAYGREYKHCYYAGTFVGPCAVAINSDNAVQHTFPYPQYQHTLVLAGGGILDGGTAAFNGPAAAMYMAPETAVVAFP